jgi:hypothetical protein
MINFLVQAYLFVIFFFVIRIIQDIQNIKTNNIKIYILVGIIIFVLVYFNSEEKIDDL